MTTALSKKGQIVLPTSAPTELRLEPGDDFEIQVQDDDSILLRRISRPPNKGLVKLLAACPHPFELPERDRDETAPIQL